MNEDKKARQRANDPKPERKSPSTLPGPNRFPDAARYGEALAPGTIPEDERRERQRRTRDEKAPAGGKRP